MYNKVGNFENDGKNLGKNRKREAIEHKTYFLPAPLSARELGGFLITN